MAGASRPAALGRTVGSAAPLAAATGSAGAGRFGPTLGRIGWTIASVGLFAGLWELCWLFGWADPKLLPPPHIFIGAIPDQLKFFNTASRWEMGQDPNAGPTPLEAMFLTMGATLTRVLVGLFVATVLAISIGVLVRYFKMFENLTLPTITLLAPISPVAWLPVALFIFGIGNGPAIFMVVIALFFSMVLATIAHIDMVNRNYVNVARTMGCTKWQTYRRVVIPAILPGLLMLLRMNLFGAWMAVLIAEATGVGYGLGQIIMLARNTFNPSLVFFTIGLIGMLAYLCDLLLRMVQKRVLYWVPNTESVLRGL